MKFLSFLMVISTFPVWSADPASGTVSDASPQVTWTGSAPLGPTASATCSGNDDPLCDHFALTIVDPGYDFQVRITFSATPADDYDMVVYDPSGSEHATSGNSGPDEQVILTNPAAGTWTVSAAPYAPVGPYDGVAELSAIESGGGNSTVGLEGSFLNYGPPGANGPDPVVYGPVTGDEGVALGAGEPTMGVPVANNLILQQTEPTLSRSMYIAGLETVRVTYDDCTSPAVAEWLDKSVPTHANTLDPILEVDPMTGRTFSNQLQGKAALMSFSDDEGDTWTPSQGNGINSGADHQTVGSGVFSPSDPIGPTGAYPNAVFYASQDITVAQLSVSRDGGLTFGAAVPMYNLTQCSGLHGHIQVAEDDGTVYVPNKSCSGEQGVARSDDSGTNWSVKTVPGSASGSSDPSAGTATDGTLYLGMCSNDSAALISVSTDKGDNWSAPVNVGAPYDIVNCAFPEVIAGDGDRAAFAFLGSATEGAGTSANPDFDGVWHMYLAYTYDRGVSWETTIVTPGDPVQRGAVCLSGTTCESGRNLLDFNDIELDEKGRVLIAYSDGCVGSCIDGTNNSGTDIARIARQQRGTRGLLSAFDDYMLPPVATVPDNPYATAYNFIETNELSWSVPYNGESDILSYIIYRRDEMGSFGAPLTTVLAGTNSYTDADNIAGNNYCYKITAVNAAGESSGCFETCAQAPAVQNSCDLPGAIRSNDDSGDSANPATDALQLFTAEPFFGDPLDCGTPSDEKLVFTLNIDDALTAAQGNAWVIMWNRANLVLDDTDAQSYDRNMVNMRMTALGPECHFGAITAPSVNKGDDITTLPAEDCILKDNGEITIRISKSDILDNNCGATDHISDCSGVEADNYSLDGLEVRTFSSNTSGQPVSQASSDDLAAGLSYSFIGNESCRLDAEPVADPDVAESGVDPIVIGVLSNDNAGDCDTLTITSVGTPHSGDILIGGAGTYLKYYPVNSINGEEVFNYEITDESGNTSSATVTIIQNDEIISFGGFEPCCVQSNEIED